MLDFALGGLFKMKTSNEKSEGCSSAENKSTARAPRKAVAKTRPPARPYRRLPADVLSQRINDGIKKRDLLKSRLIILEQRLQAHELEDKTRKAPTENSPTANVELSGKSTNN